MVGALRRVLVRAPSAAFGAADPERWHYAGAPDLGRARAEHAAFVEIVASAGCEVIEHDTHIEGAADAQFVHDPVIVGNQGAILLRMGKALRRGEENAIGEALEAAGVPIHARLRGEATAEGGDLLWLDRHTLAVGQGFRTNAEGLRQLRTAFDGTDVDLVPVQLPYASGEVACLHLMSLVSMVDDNLAVAYEPLLPVPFWSKLRDQGIHIVPVPEEELSSLGPNVLALSPRRCVMLAGNPVTQRRLEAVGCEVLTYTGDEISVKAEGGATCLTRPILRD